MITIPFREPIASVQHRTGPRRDIVQARDTLLDRNIYGILVWPGLKIANECEKNFHHASYIGYAEKNF